MLKNMLSFFLVLGLSVTILSGAAIAYSAAPLAVVIAGGYAPLDIRSKEVNQAAQFAARTLSGGRANVKKIIQAQSQVVAGVNYSIDMILTNGKRYRVTVFKPLPLGRGGAYQLTQQQLITASTPQPPKPLPQPPIAVPVPPVIPIVGGDRDAKGCIGSAGYSWCNATQSCQRPWELAAMMGFAKTDAAFKQFCNR